MASPDLKDLMDRAQHWPEAAQNELLALADQIESEFTAGDYVASREELEIIDAAIAEIDRGEIATEAEVAAAFARFSRK